MHPSDVSAAIRPAPTHADELYLSRLPLNVRSRLVRADVANSQAVHRRLLEAFPRTGNRSDHGLLYRIDPVRGGRYAGLIVLAQSHHEPDWSQLPPGYLEDEAAFGWADDTARVKPVGDAYRAINDGAIVQFRLRASPTKRIPWNTFKEAYPDRAARQEARHPGRDPRKFDGPRVPVTDVSIEKLAWERGHPGETYHHPEAADAMLQRWIVSKGRAHGFLVADVVSRPDPLTGDMQRGHKVNDRGEKLTIAHKAIVYDGVLKVTDVAAFQAALRNGIGSGKAYGFGLLSIRRLPGAA